MARSKGKRRTSKERFVWTKELILFLCGLTAAIILTIVLLIPTNKEKFNKEWQTAATTNEVSAVNIENPFKVVSYKDLVKMIDKKSDEVFFVFYGTSSDKTSLENIYSLQSECSTFNVETIYVLDSAFHKNHDEESVKDIQMIEERTEKLGVATLESYGQLWAYKSGSIAFDSKNDTYTEVSFNLSVRKCFSDLTTAGKDSTVITAK